MTTHQIFTPEMEYPDGMTDDQAFAIYKAYTMRQIAAELEYQLENSDFFPCAEDVAAEMDQGNVTAAEIVSAALEILWNRTPDFEKIFADALEMLV